MIRNFWMAFDRMLEKNLRESLKKLQEFLGKANSD